MAVCTAFDLALWPFARFDPLDNDALRQTAALVVAIAAIAVVLHRAYPVIAPKITMPWLRAAFAVAPEAVELLLFYRWIPLAITVADYLVLPHSLSLADRWLAWPEEALGIEHWRTYGWCEAHGLLPVLRLVYGSIDTQLLLLLPLFLFVVRDLRRLWEYTAVVSVAGVASIALLWALPAEGPAVYYAARYTVQPPIPPYVDVLHALRAGTLTDVTTVYGFLNFPSFHTVFALLIARAVRGFRGLGPAIAVLNGLVVVSVIPVGWHYAVDVLGGIGWTIGAVCVVRYFSAGPRIG